MEMEQIKLNKLMFGMKGLKNTGLIQISENKKTGDFVIVVGKGIQRQWGMFNLPQGLWRIICRKDEVREAVDRILTEKLLAN
jgi:hypothetical protein